VGPVRGSARPHPVLVDVDSVLLCREQRQVVRLVLAHRLTQRLVVGRLVQGTRPDNRMQVPELKPYYEASAFHLHPCDQAGPPALQPLLYPPAEGGFGQGAIHAAEAMCRSSQCRRRTVGGVRRARRPRPVAMAGLGLMLVAAVALSVAVSAWFFTAVPLIMGGIYGAWLGLNIDETLEYMNVWDDSGGGTAGMSP
jgi:hypothetical protein